MEDSDDSDAKLREEIEAELDKISISSLENDEVENDSGSETESDNSDTDLVELPESVLHCISVIKNKSKTAEELFLQDLEDTDVFSCSYGRLSNSHMNLRTGSPAESKANSEQLMKILSVIEKEEFMRSLTHSAMSDSAPEPLALDTPMDEYILPDDADLSFGYFEVEERCKKSFEAWQDKQKELEEKDKETLEAQSDIEKQKFQDDDEKRHCWIKQFEVEKEKLETLQKQDQDKMNDELHKEEKMWKEKYREHEELIRNLHLQMEEERARLSELQEKEKARLLTLQHNAAVKIQAKYRASVTYQKYSPIIREQIEKKRKEQEWKEKEAKIRQMEEERRRRIEEEQKIEEGRKKKMLEERRKREREYEEKKSILRQEQEEQRNKEKMRPREDARQPLIITCALEKGEGHAKRPAVSNVSKSKDAIAEELVNTNSKKQEDVCPVQQSSKKENVRKQLTLRESIGVKLKPSQTVLAELKMSEKNENLPKLKMKEKNENLPQLKMKEKNENIPKLKMKEKNENILELKVNEKSDNLPKKQCSEKSANQEINFENIDQKNELKSSDLKENVNTQCQGQELKSQTQKEQKVEHATKENMRQETQIMFGYKPEMNEEDDNGAPEIIKDNQERPAEKIEKKDITEQGGSLYENCSSAASMQKDLLLSLILENPEPVERNVALEDKEIDLKSKRMEEIPKDNVLICDPVVINSDVWVHTGDKTSQQGAVSGKQASSEEAGSHSVNSPLVTEEGDSPKSEIKDIPQQWKQTKAESDSVLACCASQISVSSSVEEKRLAWIKSFKPWSEVFEQNQLKKTIKKKRLMKCPANTKPPLDTSAILQHGPWNTLEQENQIESVNCENLENLCVVLLNKNLLTSIHGLDGCTNIQILEVSHNKITRISKIFQVSCVGSMRATLSKSFVSLETQYFRKSTGEETFSVNSLALSSRPSMFLGLLSVPTSRDQLISRKVYHTEGAVWKGFILRKKLATALEAIRDEESGEEYEEIDLEDFEYDEDALEKDWPVLDSTGFPSQTLPLSNQLPWPKVKCHGRCGVLHLCCLLKVLLRCDQKTELCPGHLNQTQVGRVYCNLKKKKKFQKNEPSVRLAIFRKHKSDISVTKSSKRTQLKRDDYFEDEEEDAVCKPITVNEKLEKTSEYTYQWLHTQVVFPETTSSRALKWHEIGEKLYN
ncbi:leucine-rich repeat and IQ domain-containing protein 1 [Cricetulus griseus]|nr:leucine-rich repeat and IQ domain-containing protein 1 [Cricetulus griseus]